MNIADTRRFWEILVIAVLQILEDSGKYWLYQYCRCWKILENTGYTSIADTGRLGTNLRNVLVYCFFGPFCASVMRGRQCIGRPGEKKLNYVLLCFIKLQSKPKCHGIDTIMYNSLIPFANFGSSQYSIL